MTDTYKKYLYNQFREVYPFDGVPINIYMKGKERKERTFSSSPHEYAHRHEDESEEEMDEDEC